MIKGNLRDECISHLHVDHFLTCILVKKARSQSGTQFAARKAPDRRVGVKGESNSKDTHLFENKPITTAISTPSNSRKYARFQRTQ